MEYCKDAFHMTLRGLIRLHSSKNDDIVFPQYSLRQWQDFHQEFGPPLSPTLFSSTNIRVHSKDRIFALMAYCFQENAHTAADTAHTEHHRKGISKRTCSVSTDSLLTTPTTQTAVTSATRPWMSLKYTHRYFHQQWMIRWIFVDLAPGKASKYRALSICSGAYGQGAEAELLVCCWKEPFGL